MKLQIKNEYEISVTKVFNAEIDFDIEKYIKEYEIEIPSKEDLEEILVDFPRYSYDDILMDKEDYLSGAYLEGTGEITITNLEELVEYYSYLIVPIKILSCCERAADRDSIYCPVCGSKIIY